MNKVFIIAEAGVNHNGDVNMAKRLIDEAAKAGADAVKFQTFKTELCISKKAKKAEYQVENTGNANESQYEMVKKLELDERTHDELIAHAKSKNIMFLSTPFDLSSVDLLVKKGLEIIKIPSGEITNLPYLRKIGALGVKIVLSTGMATLGEIEKAVEILENSGTKKDDIVVLHANTEYPTPFKDVNLKAMNTIAAAFGVNVGYSDHTRGIEVAIAAAAMGASVIEKHFTLDRNLPGPDHKASLEPGELAAMVSAIRNIENALGDGIKRPSASESKNIKIARKSIVASRAIKKGEIFSDENLGAKRPAGGISPMHWDEIMGRAAKRDFEIDEMIEI